MKQIGRARKPNSSTQSIHYKMMRSILISLSLIVFITTGCHQQKRNAGICLSFDDRYIKEWHEMRALLNRYHARVTFFVSQFDSLSATEIQMLADLQND